jgi:serine phosphatase RsbU (regulator of sigma subunit)
MFARTLLRAVAFSGRRPAAALRRTNELMLADSTSDMFVTAYYAILDMPSRALTYASAGHNLGLYVPAVDGPPQVLVTDGIPLGITAQAPIGQKTLTMQPGDLVVMYTDGVTEAVNGENEEFGQSRLAELLRANRHLPADAIADAIRAAVDDFIGDAPPSDDFTLVLVKLEEPL